MNKKDFIDQVAGKSGLSKAQAENAVDAVVESIVGVLKQEDSVSFPHFGSFSVKRQMARQGRNPQTGETIQIAARNAPAFKASQTLKDTLNPQRKKR